MKAIKMFAAGILLGAVGFTDSQLYTILPGSNKVNGKHIKSSFSTWKVSAITTAGKEEDRGIWTDRIEIVSYNNKRSIKRSQLFVSPEGKQLQNFSTIMDHSTLIPYYSEAVLPDGTLSTREFKGSTVTVVDKTGGVEIRREVNELESEVFDFYGGNFGILLSGFPLSVGSKFRFPSNNYDAATKKEIVQWVEFTVTAKEKVEVLPKDNTLAYRVEADLPNAYWTFWLTKTRAPYLMKLEVRRKNGVTSKWSLMPG